MPDLSVQLRVKRVPEPVADQVQRKNDDYDNQRGNQQTVWCRGNRGPGIICQGSEGCHRKIDTKSEEGKVAFGENSTRHLKRRCNDNDGKYIRHDMLSHDLTIRRSDRFCREDVLIVLDRKDLSSDQPGHADPVQEGKHDKHRQHVAAELCEHGSLDQRRQPRVQHHGQKNDD